MAKKANAPTEKSILETFGQVAETIGYSQVHGKIIGVLLIKNGEMSLQELAKRTGYSVPMISLSLDLLDVLGVVKKTKRAGDRNIYARLSGDLLECLKKAFVLRLQKSISESLDGFENIRKLSHNSDDRKALETLEKEIKRLNRYVGLLSKIRLP
jgi:DNA-binding transcriptional regulator GbsR (MarR family)